MSLADQFSTLRHRLPGVARATDEEERLLQLFRNRAELKKEYTGLQDERHELLEKLKKQGKKAKFIYTIVNFQNPGGATMTLERRKKLVSISHQYDIPIFEDDPYGYVRYDGEHLPSIP